MVSVSLRMVIALYWDDLQKSDEAASLGGLIYFAGRSKQPAAAKDSSLVQLYFIQSAKAGPGLPLHVAASSVFEIVIVPPGHVTETSFSPG